MNNLTNEQIARVFAMYLNGTPEKGKAVIRMIDPRGSSVPVTLYALSSDRAYLREAKLLLTPLSAISDEDAIEVAYIGEYDFDIADKHEREKAIEIGQTWANNIHLVRLNAYQIYQYLIQQGYAVPLFIAPGHPDNGKTAIELGLAIDKTTLSNN